MLEKGKRSKVSLGGEGQKTKGGYEVEILNERREGEVYIGGVVKDQQTKCLLKEGEPSGGDSNVQNCLDATVNTNFVEVTQHQNGMLEGDKVDDSKDKKLRYVTINKKGVGKFVEEKAITHVSNMFAALDDGKNEDNLERRMD